MNTSVLTNFGKEFIGYHSDDFNFNDYQPPLYSFETNCWMIFGYLLSIRLTTWFMQYQEKPFNTRLVSAAHNLFLFLISVVMLFGVLTNVFKLWQEGGSSAILCDPTGSYRKSKMNFWVYIFYLTKPYEFIDTFIMIFKKRELNFLHVWHHCTTFLLVWVTQVQEMNIQWISVSANCLVHSFMYYYYFIASLGMQVWWKRYLTLLQIMQFVVTILLNTYWGYAYMQGYNCKGNLFGFWFGMFIIFSFLVLFISFYIENYKTGGQPESPRLDKKPPPSTRQTTKSKQKNQ